MGGPPKGRHRQGDTEKERSNPRRHQGNIAKPKGNHEAVLPKTKTVRELGRITSLDYSTTKEDIRTLLGKFRSLTETN